MIASLGFFWVLCVKINDGLPHCSDYRYQNQHICELDGRFQSMMYQRLAQFEYVCEKVAEI